MSSSKEPTPGRSRQDQRSWHEFFNRFGVELISEEEHGGRKYIVFHDEHGPLAVLLVRPDETVQLCEDDQLPRVLKTAMALRDES